MNGNGKLVGNLQARQTRVYDKHEFKQRWA